MTERIDPALTKGNGQQLACIGCGLCIDACNSVMLKINRPQELITYDALSAQADEQRAVGCGSGFVHKPEILRTAVQRIRVLEEVVVEGGEGPAGFEVPALDHIG